MTQESTEINYPTSKVGLLVGNTHPNYMLHFHKEGKEVGSFDFNEGKMHFEGELSESGKVFVDWVLGAFKQRLDDAILAEREACAKVCEGLLERPSGYQGTWEGYGNFKTQMTGQECATAIRARGQA
jgi:hypothetical protein